LFKTILVHINGSRQDEAALALTWRVGKPFASHIDAMHVAPSFAEMAAKTLSAAGDSPASSEAFELQRIVAAQASAASRRHFDEFHRRENLSEASTPPTQQPSAAWCEKTGAAAELLAAAARYHDLLVAAGSGSERLPIADVARILFESGKPVLLAPSEVASGPIRSVAIAWKDTAEAARAVTAAMPLLAQAKRVFVLGANEDNATAFECVTCSDSLVAQLRWHGLTVEARYVLPAGRLAPVAVQETAREAGCDLLVMGAYGHSRWRETIFGGFTRYILEDGPALPVLMAH
jgi:nucleotide-binding universal stress UspA family protein